MARVNGNALTQGLSGKISNLLFRQIGKETIVSAAPQIEPDRVPTPGQQAHRNRFRQAIAYAREQMAQPTAKALYATGIDENRSNAYQVAVADFMHAPEIVAVDLRAYQGLIGQTIRIRATDDFAVEAVTLRIEAPDGSLIEEGKATPQPGGCDWVFTARVAQQPVPGTTITVCAVDRPGNQASKVCALDQAVQ